MKKLYFILTVILLIVLSKTSYAYDYDPLLMRAQATIFPKIILLDKNLERKIANNKIIINILYGDHDQHIAIKIKDLIQQQYKDSLGKQRLTINTTKFEHFDNSTSSTAYFLLKGTSVVHKKITAHAASQERMVFSYDYKDFESNTLVSVLMKEKTYIYLNKSVIHNYDIKFIPLFYKIVTVIE